METDDIILKVLFFLIIIILIMCPIRKLMEGFISDPGVIVKNVRSSGPSNKAFNGDKITFTMTTDSDHNNAPKITIKFGGVAVKTDKMSMVSSNKKKWQYTFSIPTDNSRVGKVTVTVKEYDKSGESTPKISDFTIVTACTLNMTNENMFIGVSKVNGAKFGGHDIKNKCNVDKIKGYQKQIELYEKLLVAEKGSSKRIEYKIKVAEQQKLLNRCISSWRVDGSRNKSISFKKDLNAIHISKGKHHCSDGECELFMKCPKYSSKSAQDQCLNDNSNGKSGEGWLYSNYNCVKRDAYQTLKCDIKQSSPKYIPVSNDDCNKCRHPLSEKAGISGSPLIENTEREPINANKGDKEGITQTERNGSLIYKCK